MRNLNPLSGRAAGLLLAGMLVLAACGSDGVGNGIASLGAVFNSAFNQEANDTPLGVRNANLEVDVTDEPFEL